MTIHSELDRTKHIEHDPVTFLGGLINERRRFTLSNEDERINLFTDAHSAVDFDMKKMKTFSFDSIDNYNNSLKVNMDPDSFKHKEKDNLSTLDFNSDYVGLRRRGASPNLSPSNPIKKPSILYNEKQPNNLNRLIHSNIIFQQLLNLISEQDFKFHHIENVSQIEDYIKSLDNTPVYYTYNCGVIYVPYQSK
jgi:hypothetical protein